MSAEMARKLLDLDNENRELKRQIEELRKKAILLDAFALRVIADRGCVCNEANHRCATNQLYEDLEKIHGPANRESQ